MPDNAKTQATAVTTDCLVIGSGIAGLTLALKLAERFDVMVLAKGSLGPGTNTWYAQGGIASVLSEHDDFESHVEDTMVAGAGLCHRQVVDMVVRSGPRLVKELVELGVKFTEEERGGYHLTREGGHSHRRVIHAHDATGLEIMRALLARCRENARIKLVEHQMAIDLLTTDKYAPDFSGNACIGAYVFDRQSQTIYPIKSRFTFLCTGGSGRIYLYTSNPQDATGDGIAMGWRAGCRVANLEFMQFHPTLLYHPRETTFLISEAVRGEGGVLKDRHGREFMSDYHPRASLAPRDVVARAIDTELKKSGDPCVFLDVRHLGAERIKTLFPNIHKHCLELGIDMTTEMIPVVPGAHYNCGGIVVDARGRTGIRGLYALGETACTGLHGANRLASNSLLEALVFADRAARDILGGAALQSDPYQGAPDVEVPEWNPGRAAPADELGVLNLCWDEIRRIMWHYVGIVRSDKRLKRALARIAALRQELDDYYWDFQVTDTLLEVRNLALVAELTVRCAIARKESRGIHYNIDWPESLPRAHDTIIR